MKYRLSIYMFLLIILSSCSSKEQSAITKKNISAKPTSVVNVNTSTRIDCKRILTKKIKARSSLIRYCEERKNACSSSEARSFALRRLWKLYGKKDIRTPYQVISENKVWVVKGSRHKAPSKIIHVIIPKNSKPCSIKEIFHKRRVYELHSRTPALKKASDYKCPSHIVSPDTCKKLIKFQNRR